MPLEGYLDARQTADYLGIRVESVSTYLHRFDDFPEPIRVGRGLLFKQTDLDAWRERHPKQPGH